MLTGVAGAPSGCDDILISILMSNELKFNKSVSLKL